MGFRVTSVRGYSLTEVMMALTLMAVIATLGMNSIVPSSQDKQHLFKAKYMAQQLQEGLVKWKQKNPDTEIIFDCSSTMCGHPSLSDEIIAESNYSGRVTSGNFTSTTTGVIPTAGCSSIWPCYRYPDGGIVRVVPGWGQSYINSPLENIVQYEFDPDGLEPTQPVRLIMNIETGRITTFGGHYSSSNADPTYIKGWTSY